MKNSGTTAFLQLNGSSSSRRPLEVRRKVDGPTGNNWCNFNSNGDWFNWIISVYKLMIKCIFSAHLLQFEVSRLSWNCMGQCPLAGPFIKRCYFLPALTWWLFPISLRFIIYFFSGITSSVVCLWDINMHLRNAIYRMPPGWLDIHFQVRVAASQQCIGHMFLLFLLDYRHIPRLHSFIRDVYIDSQLITAAMSQLTPKWPHSLIVFIKQLTTTLSFVFAGLRGEDCGPEALEKCAAPLTLISSLPGMSMATQRQELDELCP